MQNKKAVKIIVGIIVVIVILCALFYFAIYVPLNNYTDTHTWATITVTGEVISDTSDAFAETREYLKGDTIHMSDVTLLVEDITHAGVVSISVSSGNLYDDNGEQVMSFTIRKGEKIHYKIDNGAITISVDSNRYQ